MHTMAMSFVKGEVFVQHTSEPMTMLERLKVCRAARYVSVTGAVRVSRADACTLGRTALMLWRALERMSWPIFINPQEAQGRQ